MRHSAARHPVPAALSLHARTAYTAPLSGTADKQFHKLNAQKDDIELKVVRGGQTLLVGNHDVVVGDVMLLDTGDKIIADGYVIEAHMLVVDEASLTGESDPVKKGAPPKVEPWVRSGTQVGAGQMTWLQGLEGFEPWVRSGTQVGPGAEAVVEVAAVGQRLPGLCGCWRAWHSGSSSTAAHVCWLPAGWLASDGPVCRLTGSDLIRSAWWPPMLAGHRGQWQDAGDGSGGEQRVGAHHGAGGGRGRRHAAAGEAWCPGHRHRQDWPGGGRGLLLRVAHQVGGAGGSAVASQIASQLDTGLWLGC